MISSLYHNCWRSGSPHYPTVSRWNHASIQLDSGFHTRRSSNHNPQKLTARTYIHFTQLKRNIIWTKPPCFGVPAINFPWPFPSFQPLIFSTFCFRTRPWDLNRLLDQRVFLVDQGGYGGPFGYTLPEVFNRKFAPEVCYRNPIWKYMQVVFQASFFRGYVKLFFWGG